jgi:tetratricopeptide (TPR) repeat protein
MLRLVFASLLLASAPVILAQSTEELERRFEEAERFYKVQKFQEALSIYEELYLKTGSPELLYNIAQCYRLLGDYDKALLSYNSFLRDVPETELRAQVEGLIAEVKLKAAEPKPTTSAATTGPTSTKLSDPVLVPVEGRALSARPFFLAAGGAGAVWAVSGVLALRAAGDAEELLEEANATVDEFEARRRKARLLGGVADVSFVGAVALGSVGLVVRSKGRVVEVSATGLSFAMEF